MQLGLQVEQHNGFLIYLRFEEILFSYHCPKNVIVGLLVIWRYNIITWYMKRFLEIWRECSPLGFTHRTYFHCIKGGKEKWRISSPFEQCDFQID